MNTITKVDKTAELVCVELVKKYIEALLFMKEEGRISEEYYDMILGFPFGEMVKRPKAKNHDLDSLRKDMLYELERQERNCTEVPFQQIISFIGEPVKK